MKNINHPYRRPLFVSTLQSIASGGWVISFMRQPIGNRLRFTILERDNFTCRYCGATSREAKLEVDHIKPVYLGGKNDENNLITACKPCNIGKNRHELRGILPIQEQKISLIELLQEKYRPELQEICDLWYGAYPNTPLNRMSFVTLLQYKRKNEAIIVDALRNAIANNKDPYFAYIDWLWELDDDFGDEDENECVTSLADCKRSHKIVNYLKPTT